MRRSQADSTNRSLAAFGKLQHIRRGHVAPILFRSELHESFNHRHCSEQDAGTPDTNTVKL